MCNVDDAPDPQLTPSREEAGANDTPSEINDNCEENEGTGDDEEEEAAINSLDTRKKEHRKWTVIGRWMPLRCLDPESKQKYSLLQLI